jgi:hypothetical protein
MAVHCHDFLALLLPTGDGGLPATLKSTRSDLSPAMKINVEFDMTPAEFRQALGLPDVDAFQREMMSRIQQQMEAGVEGYDPWNLMQPFLQQGMTQGMTHFGNYQQMMLDMLRKAGSPSSAEKASTDDKAGGSANRSSATASASSRQNRKS